MRCRQAVRSIATLIALAPMVASLACRIQHPLDGRQLLLALHIDEALAAGSGRDLAPAEPGRRREALAAATAATIGRRLDALGISHSVERLPADRLRVKLQQLDPPRYEHCRHTITTAGSLTVHLATFQKDGGAGLPREKILAHYGGQLPADVAMVPDRQRQLSQQAADHGTRYLAVQLPAVLTGSDFRYVRPVSGPLAGTSSLQFSLQPEAAATFRDFTAAHQGKALAFVLDGWVRTVPTIRGPIGADGVIDAGMTRDEIEELATLLRSGALPVPVTILEEGAPAAKTP